MLIRHFANWINFPGGFVHAEKLSSSRRVFSLVRRKRLLCVKMFADKRSMAEANMRIVMLS